MQMITEPVAIVKYNGTSNSLKRAIELCNGFKELVENNKIILKPNIVWGGGGTRKMPKYGFITTSRIIDDLIQQRILYIPVR